MGGPGRFQNVGSRAQTLSLGLKLQDLVIGIHAKMGARQPLTLQNGDLLRVQDLRLIVSVVLTAGIVTHLVIWWELPHERKHDIDRLGEEVVASVIFPGGSKHLPKPYILNRLGEGPSISNSCSFALEFSSCSLNVGGVLRKVRTKEAM